VKQGIACGYFLGWKETQYVHEDQSLVSRLGSC
jgi:hypothetical protein